jgi:hypothetical protein
MPGQLAQLAGCTNIAKNGNRIRQFERTGNISRELLERISPVLDIEPGNIRILIEQDRREFFDEWLKWVNEPIQPYLVVRLMAAIYSQRPLPPAIATMEQAEKWASEVARKEKLRCCLVWSRRISSWFDDRGTLTARTQAVPGQANVPWMQMGGKRFLFGDDFGSVAQADWPRKPPFDS